MKRAVSGFSSITAALKIASKVGFGNFYRSITSRNTCKTCALGMGGQKGGMTNEVSSFPEICKKSIQAQLTDIQQAIPESLFQNNTIADQTDHSEKTGKVGSTEYTIVQKKRE